MPRFRSIAILITLIIAIAHNPASAEVVDSSEAGFAVKNEATIAATPKEVYIALTKGIGKWWDSAHTFSGDAQNLTLDARPGGCFCERLPGQGGVQHALVVYVSPRQELRLSGALGPFQETGVAGSLIWKMSEFGDDTKVELRYTVGGYRSGGVQALAGTADMVLGEQLSRLKSYVETGRPAPE